MVVGKEFTIV